MTRQPAAPGMTTLVEAAHQDAPSEAVSVVVRFRAANVVVDRAAKDRGGTTGVPPVGGLEEVIGAVRIEVLGAERIAMTSGEGRCWRRRSRDCRSRRFPMM
jgi:hypothetical protein